MIAGEVTPVGGAEQALGSAAAAGFGLSRTQFKAIFTRQLLPLSLPGAEDGFAMAMSHSTSDRFYKRFRVKRLRNYFKSFSSRGEACPTGIPSRVGGGPRTQRVQYNACVAERQW